MPLAGGGKCQVLGVLEPPLKAGASDKSSFKATAGGRGCLSRPYRISPSPVPEVPRTTRLPPLPGNPSTRSGGEHLPAGRRRRRERRRRQQQPMVPAAVAAAAGRDVQPGPASPPPQSGPRRRRLPPAASSAGRTAAPAGTGDLRDGAPGVGWREPAAGYRTSVELGTGDQL